MLLLTYVARGLAMRGHPQSSALLAALMDVATGDLLPLPTASATGTAQSVDAATASLATSALCGLVTEPADSDPLHRASGAVVLGLFKQKLFGCALARYRQLRSESLKAREGLAMGAAPSPAAQALQRAAERLLLPLAAMATALPQAAVLGDIENVLPIIIQVLATVAPRLPPPATGSALPPAGKATYAISPRLQTASTAATATPTTASASASASNAAVSTLSSEVVNGVILASLRSLRTAMREPSSSSHVGLQVHSIVPTLVALARNAPGALCQPMVRAGAVECLRALLQSLPHHKLFPIRGAVISGLLPALDDPKRAVRRRAAACRNEWMTLSSKGAGGR